MVVLNEDLHHVLVRLLLKLSEIGLLLKFSPNCQGNLSSTLVGTSVVGYYQGPLYALLGKHLARVLYSVEVPLVRCPSALANYGVSSELTL